MGVKLNVEDQSETHASGDIGMNYNNIPKRECAIRNLEQTSRKPVK